MDITDPERLTPEVRYSQIAGAVKAWAEKNGMDYGRSILKLGDGDEGVWQTPDGEKLHVYAALGGINVIIGDEHEGKRYKIELGERPEDHVLRYEEGRDQETGFPIKYGRYGKLRFLEFDGRIGEPDTDVFPPIEEVVKMLQTAQKVTS